MLRWMWRSSLAVVVLFFSSPFFFKCVRDKPERNREEGHYAMRHSLLIFLNERKTHFSSPPLCLRLKNVFKLAAFLRNFSTRTFQVWWTLGDWIWIPYNIFSESKEGSRKNLDASFFLSISQLSREFAFSIASFARLMSESFMNVCRERYPKFV